MPWVKFVWCDYCKFKAKTAQQLEKHVNAHRLVCFFNKQYYCDIFLIHIYSSICTQENGKFKCLKCDEEVRCRGRFDFFELLSHDRLCPIFVSCFVV
jgi:hypothetical protein